MRRLITALLTCLLLVGLFPLAAAAADPSATTEAATAVTSSSADLQGTGTPNGEQTTGWFRISTTDPGTCDDAFGDREPAAGGADLGTGVVPVLFSTAASGLTAGVTYYYCAIVQNASSTQFGQVASFLAAEAPGVAATAGSNLGTTTADVSATIATNGADTTAWFRYATTDPGTCDDSFGTRAPASGGTAIPAATVSGTADESLSGLAPGSTYYLCAIAQNSAGTSVSATVATFDTLEADTPPTVSGVTTSTDEDTAKTITLTASDVDSGDSPGTFSIVDSPSHGLLGSFTASQCSGTAPTTCTTTVSYTPVGEYAGSDNFTYSAKGADDVAATKATVNITVDAVNDPPSFTPGSDVSVELGSGAYSGGWAAAISAGPGESDTVTFTVTPLNATLFTVQPAISGTTGTLTFTPGAAAGSTSVTVKAVDDGSPAAESAEVTFAVTITDGPAAVAQVANATEDSGEPITLEGLDTSGDALTFAIGTPPAHGTLGTIGTPDCVGTAPSDCTASVTYTPSANYFGADSFTFTVTDGITVSPAATVTIDVANVNDPVDARFDTKVPVTATVTTVLDLFKANGGSADSAGPGEPVSELTITGVTKPGHGTVTITNAGTRVTYDPSGCYYGTDTFDYTISDGQYSDTATVIVQVNRPGVGGVSTKPITDTPGTSFVTGSTMGTTVPVKVSWCGITTSSTSVKGYKVQQSTNAGSTYPTTLSFSTTAKSTIRNVGTNNDYRWRVRTTDKLSRTGSYRQSSVSWVRRYQESSTRITYSGSWGTSTAGTPSGGSEKFSKAAGAAAEITVSNVRQFAIVGPKSSTRGSFKVFIDGQLVATVSEKATTTAYRKVLYVKTISTATHVIRIEAVSGTRIDLDSILTLASS